jgi:hypothetical protein
MKNDVAVAARRDSAYAWLSRLGGIACLVVVDLTLSEIVFFAISPQPSAISEWFALFRRSWVVGLISFWGLERPMYVMFVLVFLALYTQLRKRGPSAMAVAVTFALLGVAVFLATNNPVSMLALARQHAAAASEAERSLLLSAGQAVLTATSQRGVGGLNVGLFLVSIAGLLTSCVMLRNKTFGRPTALVGIIANALSLADYPRQALTSSPVIALAVILPGAAVLMVWFTLVGLRLIRMSRTGGSARR